MSAQPRDPNGQFGEKPHKEAAVVLDPPVLPELPDEEYNRDGSFFYPVRPRSPQQHVSFWMRVQVPDDVLLRVQTMYEQRRASEIAQATRPAKLKWEKAGWLDDKEQLKRDYEDAVSAAKRVRPTVIGRTDIRTIVRAERCYSTSAAFDEEAKQSVKDFQVETMVLGKRSLAELRQIYRLNELEGALDPRPDQTEDLLRAIATATRSTDVNMSLLANDTGQ